MSLKLYEVDSTLFKSVEDVYHLIEPRKLIKVNIVVKVLKVLGVPFNIENTKTKTYLNITGQLGDSLRQKITSLGFTIDKQGKVRIR